MASGSDQIVEQYRTALKGLRQDFLERTAVTTKICVLQISERMERQFNQLSDQIWDSGKLIILLGNEYPLKTIWKTPQTYFVIYRMVKACTSTLPDAA